MDEEGLQLMKLSALLAPERPLKQWKKVIKACEQCLASLKPSAHCVIMDGYFQDSRCGRVPRQLTTAFYGHLASVPHRMLAHPDEGPVGTLLPPYLVDPTAGALQVGGDGWRLPRLLTSLA